MRSWQRQAAAIAVAGCLACLFATPAQATHVVCGEVITQDTTLDSDLLNCPSDGIVIGASGITLNLGGHLIDGPDPPVQQGVVGTPVGVFNRARHDGVTVKNGRIREFGTGVVAAAESNDLRPVAGSVVRNLDVTSNLGVAAANVTGLRVSYNRILSRTRSVFLQDSSGATVRDNAVDSFPPLRFAADITLFSFGDGSHHNLVAQNTAMHGTISVQGHDDVVTRNEVLLDGGIGASGTRQLVSRNLVDSGNGIVVLGSAHVYKNEVRSNGFDGIRAEFGPSVIDHNTAVGNGTRSNGTGTGVVVRASAAGTLVRRNRANDNAGLGILAESGTVDGGANKARGNGNPAQCVGVTCK